MIELKVSYNPPFRDLTLIPGEEFQLQEGETIKDLIEKLEEKYGEKFSKEVWDKKSDDGFHDRLAIIVNGNSYRGDDFLTKKLDNGATVWFAHSFFGG